MAGEIHVMPVNDDIEHLDDDCPCGPTTEAVPRDDGSMGWVVMHHSLDGAPKPATDQDVADALAKASPRVQLMIKLGVFIGLRAMEIAAVATSDVVITEAGATLRILGKGSKTRIVPISDDVAELIIYRPDGYLFPGHDNGHLAPATISRYVSKTLPKGVTCHKLRHRFATRAYRNSGNDLRSVQFLLGHASIATTEMYVAVDGESLRRAALSAA